MLRSAPGRSCSGHDATIMEIPNDSLVAARDFRSGKKHKTNDMKITILRTMSSTLAIAALLACGQLASAQTSVTSTTTTAGTISEFSPDTIVVRTESSPEPIRYTYSKTTTYVDETGAPVPMEMVKSGLPVTVHYVKQGDRMVANKVIVRKRTTTSTSSSPAVQEKRTTTTVAPAPAIEEKRTTTTTTTEK